MSTKHLIALATVAVAVMVAPVAATASGGHDPRLLVTGLQGGAGSTIGPDGALYVTESAAGRISRVDPRTGAVRTYASGLPASSLGFGGARDVEFIGRTAYVLVTAVGPDVGGSDTVGIYRVDGPRTFTVVADIGTFSAANPPNTPFDLPTGVQYALETYRGGFLVTDGHHNRVLRVTRRGHVSERIAFANIVPTGLALRGSTVYMAEAGAVPHLPADGKVVAFGPRASTATEIASGAPLLVDVEFARGRTLYALAQGVFGGGPPGSPALPDTGSLVRVNRHGTFTVVEDGLDRPTSLEFIASTAFIVTLSGQIWKLDSVTCPPTATVEQSGARSGSGKSTPRAPQRPSVIAPPVDHISDLEDSEWIAGHPSSP
jgi:hypothetical protein